MTTFVFVTERKNSVQQTATTKLHISQAFINTK